ncbi:putative phage tail protein [Clostridium sporogenes]|uniref:putative phage tail protein n=1 Tax=Clostridium sporogenes TaxID=1509 RepID=UPI003119DBB7
MIKLHTQQLINNLHKRVRQDPYIIELCNSSGLEMDTIEDVLEDIRKQFKFETMTWGADLLASEMNIKLDPTLKQDEKNSIIAARWKSEGKADLNLLQAICNSWHNGNVEVKFVNGKIQLKFNGIYGIPTDLDSLKKQIDLSKPSHLAIDYLFAYLLLKDVEAMTLTTLENTTLSNFAF